ncbi:7165_t:CDS:2, partial [Dentiscutata heterogama]
ELALDLESLKLRIDHLTLDLESLELRLDHLDKYWQIGSGLEN